MKVVRVKGPDNSKMEGAFYIQPLELFEAKGVRWTRSLEYRALTSAATVSGRAYVVRYWGEPRYKVSNCGNVGSFALDGSGWKDCDCEECVEGRKEVAAGWMPE